MTDKSGSCRVVTFAPVKSLDDFTQERLEEFFDVVSVDYTDDGLEIYKGYKNASFKEEELAAFIAANGLDLPACTIELLESANWLKDYVIQFAPVEVEDFLIYGVHEKKAPQTDKLAIRIYAATAFGFRTPDHQILPQGTQRAQQKKRAAHPYSRRRHRLGNIVAGRCQTLARNRADYRRGH